MKWGQVVGVSRDSKGIVTVVTKVTTVKGVGTREGGTQAGRGRLAWLARACANTVGRRRRGKDAGGPGGRVTGMGGV